MRPLFLLSLGASAAVHGAALAALLPWSEPSAAPRGREQARDVRLLVARLDRPDPPPPRPPRPERTLPQPPVEVEDLPELREEPVPEEPLPEATFARTEFRDAPARLRHAVPRRIVPEEPPPREEPEEAEEPAPEPPAPEPATAEPEGEPDPVEVLPTPIHEPLRYPRRARVRGIEGAVVLELTVSAGGRVLDVEVAESSGSGLLDRTALEAVEGWRFEPGTRDGEPVEMKRLWRVRFRLDP